MKIKECAVGDTVLVKGYSKNSPAIRKRLSSMGLTRGVMFLIQKVAPLGDPVKIEVRGFSLSLRKEEADAINVEVTNG